MDTWKQIKEEYVAGGVTYSALAERYGIPLGTLGGRAKAEHWTDLRRARENADWQTLSESVPLEEGSSSDAEPEEANGVPDISAIADKLLLRLSELADTMRLDTQGVRQLTSALKELREIKAREADTENGTLSVKVVFDAGKEGGNE